ncbi:hypothetical protein JYU34_010163 [Plutella xylostella]|uniref:Uncharacterized protein n=1 Tax=Plutella xylostella TaxID=51655 RepID=A0ABQ7QHX8_PLUXY|nr:hypothetical protein JYU34_010163 [Plutella xylostella]
MQFSKICLITFLLYFCKNSEGKIINNVIPGYSVAGVENAVAEQDRDNYRPCPYYDLLCIRRYLSKHSNCKIALGPVPDPVYRDQSNLYFPTFKMSVTMNGLTIGGLNGVIREFYANRKDDLTILAVEFTNVTVVSNTAVFQYQRPGREPVVTNSSTNEFYPSFITTTVFRGVQHLDLANSETTAFLSTQPAIRIDPSAGVAPDPAIAPRYAVFLASIGVVAAETFMTTSVYYAATYIQYDVCDFGLRVN